ncbi:hypothetical protein SCLCIDRAFT_25764 [Scleroderma citrinum Foug A]|uniref:Uncharacterized protein n=1 Tax=Scleroderma citrinum Foug A TaxID=1036808 RepID=A0A0C3E0L7_9AGAM|nr:hypothetical protein SCLCIDRAFT_25764 [Scleroderma citrinum Foug A]
MPIGSAFSLALILSDCFSFDFIRTLDTLFAQHSASVWTHIHTWNPAPMTQ